MAKSLVCAPTVLRDEAVLAGTSWILDLPNEAVNPSASSAAQHSHLQLSGTLNLNTTIQPAKSDVTMLSILTFILTIVSFLGVQVSAKGNNGLLVGTWSSKSGKVLTGPNFYNPVAETINEPSLTGISYSFTSDGHYEEALFRAIPNPVDPSCPGAIIQWQHGSFVQAADSSLQLTPIAVDGRQLLSQPCERSTSIFTRYEQNETFTKAEIETDSYNGRLRLNLFQWDGTPVNPMWLVYDAPEMLPTTTLNPTVTSSSSGAGATPTDGYKIKRMVETGTKLLQSKTLNLDNDQKSKASDVCFWMGVGSLSIGSILYFSV